MYDNAANQRELGTRSSAGAGITLAAALSALQQAC